MAIHRPLRSILRSCYWPILKYLFRCPVIRHTHYFHEDISIYFCLVLMPSDNQETLLVQSMWWRTWCAQFSLSQEMASIAVPCTYIKWAIIYKVVIKNSSRKEKKGANSHNIHSHITLLDNATHNQLSGNVWIDLIKGDITYLNIHQIFKWCPAD